MHEMISDALEPFKMLYFDTVFSKMADLNVFATLFSDILTWSPLGP